jgi:hypothetical protein
MATSVVYFHNRFTILIHFISRECLTISSKRFKFNITAVIER